MTYTHFLVMECIPGPAESEILIVSPCKIHGNSYEFIVFVNTDHETVPNLHVIFLYL